MIHRPKNSFTCRRSTDRNVILQRGEKKSAWQLNTRDRSGGAARGSFVHYIAAGGLRQLRRTQADDLAARSATRFFVLLGALACVWAFFYVLPCS